MSQQAYASFGIASPGLGRLQCRQSNSRGTPAQQYATCWSRSRLQKTQAYRRRRDQQNSFQSEAEFQDELQPGSAAARPPPLAVESIEQRKLWRQSSSGDSVLLDPWEEAEGTSSVLQTIDDVNGALANTWLGRKWDSLPARYKIVFATSLAFVICNMDKVNISVAIIPMAQDFGWSPTVAGLVQASFFWGYMLSQVPGGYMASRYGGSRVLPAGVGLWSAATAAVPILAGTIPGLFISRAAVGLGEGCAPSAATDMVARVVATEERSRAISFIFGGLHVGSLLGLFAAPPLIERFGWPVVFYIFGAAGLAWSVWFNSVLGGIRETEPDVADKLLGNGLATASSSGSSLAAEEPVPWRAFLRSTPVRALGYTHFCNNWFHYTMLAWLPTYFTDTMSLNLSQAAHLSLIPPIASIAASAIAGPTADALIAKGWKVGLVRKLAQCTAFLGPTACLFAASHTEDGPTLVALISAALGLASFSLAGLYCNHADLSPRYAPVLLGLTNTGGAIPGIIGVATTGYLLEQTHSWPMALFLPSMIFFVTGAAVFTAFGSDEAQAFDNNKPFGIEAPLAPVFQAVGQAKAAVKLPTEGLVNGKRLLKSLVSKMRQR